MLNNLSAEIITSASGKKWQLKEVNDHLIEDYISKIGVSNLVARLLINRNIAYNDAKSYLAPTIKDTLPNPNSLRGMNDAVTRVIKAINNGEKIAVFGDYDVDGATSSSLLKRYFTSLNIDLTIYIPDRVLEGYGPNINALRSLKEQDITLVITVDCGTAANEVLNLISAEGVDIVVIDHHIAGDSLPNISAVINPNCHDDSSSLTYLAAVGVTFLFLVGLNQSLRKQNFFIDKSIKEPNLLDLLDIVALGTVCDVVPLIGVNRTFVLQGMKIMSNWEKEGFKALATVAQINQYPNIYHLGFLLGPRINAGGRVGEAGLGTQLLCTQDAAEAAEIATKLDLYNSERKAIEFFVLESAIAQVESSKNDYNILIVVGEGWHQGVIGIVASRIKDKYNKPSLVISLDGDIGKGSCRSVRGFNIGEKITLAKEKNILIAGGGHAMAAGFSIEKNKIEELQLFLHNLYADHENEIAQYQLRYFENIVTVDYINLEIANNIESVGPYGAGNEEPLFCIKDVAIKRLDILSNQHIKLLITDAEINIGKLKSAMAFRAVGEKLGDFLLSNKTHISLIGYIRKNTWQGRDQPNFIISDAF
jgi:single-stranded-DNA-specific exonuclease